jgi:predicted nucleic acid-binding protein
VARALVLLDDRWQNVETREVDDRLIGLAARVIDRHRLKTFDALHLATALDAGRPELLFATWDAELGRSAEAEGLAVVP